MAIVTDGLNATFVIILFADVNYISNSGLGVFIRFYDFMTKTSHEISLPYSNNVTSAPDMMLHSSKPGTLLQVDIYYLAFCLCWFVHQSKY